VSPVLCGSCQLHGDVFPFDLADPDNVGNCVVDIDDLLVILAAFAASPNHCASAGGPFPDAVNLFPCGQACPDGVVDIDDVVAELGAFAGNFVCPHPCPANPCASGGSPSPPGGPGPGPMAPLPPPSTTENVIFLVANPSTISRGELVSVDALVILGFTQDFRAYQVAVDVTGGTTGTLDQDSLSIDTTRGDFVFSAIPPGDVVIALDESGGRLASALYSGGVVGVSNEYLGTFTFRASPDAGGTFTISVRLADTLLRDSARAAVALQDTISAQVTVEVP